MNKIYSVLYEYDVFDDSAYRYSMSYNAREISRAFLRFDSSIDFEEALKNDLRGYFNSFETKTLYNIPTELFTTLKLCIRDTWNRRVE